MRERLLSLFLFHAVVINRLFRRRRKCCRCRSFVCLLLFWCNTYSLSFWVLLLITFHQTWVEVEQTDDSENFEIFLEFHADQLIIMIRTAKHSASLNIFSSSIKPQQTLLQLFRCTFMIVNWSQNQFFCACVCIKYFHFRLIFNARPEILWRLVRVTARTTFEQKFNSIAVAAEQLTCARGAG